MTPLEGFLLLLVWIFVGCFICQKRNWYRHRATYADPSKETCSFFTILLSPIALIIAFFREFIIGDWKNEKTNIFSYNWINILY